MVNKDFMCKIRLLWKYFFFKVIYNLEVVKIFYSCKILCLFRFYMN